MKRGVLKNSKGEFNISFGLIFALIAGAIILMLAIIFVVKLRGIELSAKEAETGKSIQILTNPLESSFESSQKIVIITPLKTRIYSKCSEKEGVFGEETISTSQMNNGKWKESEINFKTNSKYIFSENPSESKRFYVFSKPFEFPYKIGDLIYITSSESIYCFIDPPEKIEEEIELLNQENLKIDDCPKESINVCFSNKQNCKVRVYYSQGYTIKNNKKMYFYGESLMYASIFSNKEEYECQVKRLIKRAESLNRIYLEKNELINKRANCGAEITPELIIFGNLLKNFENSEDLYTLKDFAENLQNKESSQECGLW